MVLCFVLQSLNLKLQADQEIQRRTLLQNDLKAHNITITQLKNAEKHLQKELEGAQEGNKGVGSELRRVKE